MSAPRELTERTELCLPDGRLNPAAVGWARRPLIDSGGLGRSRAGAPPRWGRTKRWEYWGITTPSHVIGVTISSLDYAGVHQFFVLDRGTGEQTERGALVPLAAGTVLPDAPPPFTAQAAGRGHRFAFQERPDGTRLLAELGGLRLDARVAGGQGDALGVVVPWGEQRFQYTLKAPALAVTGSLWLGGEAHPIPAGSFAVLDRGRGRWPYRMTWNWAAGSGVVAGARTGLQLGGAWTRGTGVTENALFLDGVCHPLPEELDWYADLARPERPWRIAGPRVDVELTPFGVRRAETNALIVAGRTVQAFGRFSGWIEDDAGVRRSVAGLEGWAEEANNRW